MFGEVEFRVKCEAKNFGMFVCGDGGVVDLESELGVVFCWVWCEKGGGRLVWVECEVVVKCPLIDLVEVWLEVRLGDVYVLVGC